MTSSQSTNAALLRSLQRVRERQARVGAATSAQTKTRPPSNTTTIETITTGPNGEQRVERRVINDSEQPKPQWNSSTAFQPTKIPRSVFVDGNQPTDNVVQRQVFTSSASTPYSSYNPDMTTSVKVVPLPTSANEYTSRSGPVYIQQPSQQSYSTTTKLIRTDPEVIVLESQPGKRSFFDRFRRNPNYRTNYYGENAVLLNPPESQVYRCCKCCAGGRLASACPSCYFCELFYGCPVYCWLLTFLLLLLPMLAVFGWLLSEQPAINPAKRQYVTQQSSIYENAVYDVMRNCAQPYCTNGSPATTTLVYYLAYRDYSVTQITSNANTLSTFSFVLLLFCVLFFASF